MAVLPRHAPRPTQLERVPNDLAKLKRMLDRMARQGELRACYEASLDVRDVGTVREQISRADAVVRLYWKLSRRPGVDVSPVSPTQRGGPMRLRTSAALPLFGSRSSDRR